jgi:hypothetical protein
MLAPVVGGMIDLVICVRLINDAYVENRENNHAGAFGTSMVA